MGDQCGGSAHSRRCARGLDASMPTTYDNNFEMFHVEQPFLIIKTRASQYTRIVPRGTKILMSLFSDTKLAENHVEHVFNVYSPYKMIQRKDATAQMLGHNIKLNFSEE